MLEGCGTGKQGVLEKRWFVGVKVATTNFFVDIGMKKLEVFWMNEYLG